MRTELAIPRATYRLQFHRGFTLRDALGLVPYLSALGVSHVYASPLLKAQPASTHGYDVCDPARINPELGGEADLEALVSALRERGMGLVLDIVPNHMAAVAENPWWWDVLKHGPSSAFADYFDIDWNSPEFPLRGKVLLPVLGDTYERVLDRRELNLVFENGEVHARYFEHRFPVSPESIRVYGTLLKEALAAINPDRQALDRFLGQQHYRLACWREGDTRLNYRRFFTITHLAGVRVESPQVFADTHQLILDWRRRGLLDGLRVDHPDGLRDPQDYLVRLTHAAPGAWIVVEKILESGEDLPAEWPIAGTTGYDFLNRVGGLFFDPRGENPLTDFYTEFTGEPTDYGALVRDKKRWILRHQLVAEIGRLVCLLEAILSKRSPERAPDPRPLREALVELMACFPIYRNYSRAGEGLVSAADRARVTEAAAQALSVRTPPLPTVLAFLCDLLQLALRGDLESEFVMRFQQLTGPAMAKGVEDTAYYCFNRFVALNEVGGDPGRFGVSVEEFHRACGLAREQWPNAMLATSTHDTKRGEDVRARMALLSEIPEAWMAAVRRWSASNEKHRRDRQPDRNAEYLFYQTLVGAWPLELDRALAYMEKAAREAKQHTNWSDPDIAYEAALREFVTGALGDREFVEDLERFVAPLVDAGRVNSLAQTLLKLTAPGVPDLYQGADLWDLSLVDPDNRRPVDFEWRADALAELGRLIQTGKIHELIHGLLNNSADGRVKLFVIHQALDFRRRRANLFRDGGYAPLVATGRRSEHVCAFARSLDGATAVTVVPRLLLGLATDRGGLPIGDSIWEDTRLILPRAQAGRPFRNVLTGEFVSAVENEAGASFRLADVLGGFPAALLENLDTPAQIASTTLQVP